MIEVTGLTKHYGAFTALKDVSFSVGKGQVIGLLGPNGAGKTTTMKILTSFMPQSAGVARIQGFDTLENPMQIRRLVGYLPESNPLYPEMTVEAYLNFSGQARGITGKQLDRRLRSMVDACKLSTVYYKPIGHLSKGFRQRVGLAQAMLHDPKILILDEPTSGLDPNQIVDMLQLIRDLGTEKTVIHSTHILSEAQETCDRVLILSKGRLVSNSSPHELSQKASGHSVHLTLKGNVEDAVEIWQQCSWVQGVVKRDSSEHTALELKCQENRDMCLEVADFCKNHSWDVIGLSYHAPSLERIFQTLTRTGGE